MCESCEKFQRGGFSNKDLAGLNRKSRARAQEFNYFGSCFVELDKALDKEEIKRGRKLKEITPEKRKVQNICDNCENLIHPTEMNQVLFNQEDFEDVECMRCWRHSKVFGRTWPSRRPKLIRTKGAVCPQP